MSDFYVTRPIGEVFTDENGVQLKVVPSFSCVGCYYYDDTFGCRGIELMGLCSRWDRTDKTSVIFVEVKGGQQ